MNAAALMQRCAQRKQKRNQNTLDAADFVRDVDKSGYHQLIAGAAFDDSRSIG
jgi:hypothetical protein